jgi:thiamine-monophosphate kinase
VSDGLLIDLSRMAEASGVAAVIELDTVPLSQAYIEARAENREARITAVTAGDDYELLFFAAPAQAPAILAAADALELPFSRIGEAVEGRGLSLTDRDGDVPLPTRLGYEHRSG